MTYNPIRIRPNATNIDRFCSGQEPIDDYKTIQLNGRSTVGLFEQKGFDQLVEVPLVLQVEVVFPVRVPFNPEAKNKKTELKNRA